MDLLINIYGTKVSCTKERIVLSFPKTKGISRKKEEYPIRQIEKIIIIRASSITMHAVKLALDNDVDISFLGRFGKPIGRFLSSEPKGLASIRRAQLEVAISPEQSFDFAKLFIKIKCENQIAQMYNWAGKYGKNLTNEIGQAKAMLDNIDGIPAGKKDRDQLRGIEGRIATRYFSALRKFFIFPGRKPQGKDKFNNAVNYGYGFIYNEIEKACFDAGLDPSVGLLHAEGYSKSSLVYDLIEEFRVPAVDSVIFPLFMELKIDRQKCFERVSKYEYRLSTEGKSVIASAVLTRLNEKFLWKGKNLFLKDIIKEQSRSIARAFLGKEIYTPFKFKPLYSPLR
ncbi:MAG: CRISPR-associated endonuclease Cas1 [Patescibacteria group bacterium]